MFDSSKSRPKFVSCNAPPIAHYKSQLEIIIVRVSSIWESWPEALFSQAKLKVWVLDHTAVRFQNQVLRPIVQKARALNI